MFFLPVFFFFFGNTCGFRAAIKNPFILKLKDENQRNELATSLEFW